GLCRDRSRKHPLSVGGLGLPLPDHEGQAAEGKGQARPEQQDAHARTCAGERRSSGRCCRRRRGCLLEVLAEHLRGDRRRGRHRRSERLGRGGARCRCGRRRLGRLGGRRCGRSGLRGGGCRLGCLGGRRRGANGCRRGGRCRRRGRGRCRRRGRGGWRGGGRGRRRRCCGRRLDRRRGRGRRGGRGRLRRLAVVAVVGVEEMEQPVVVIGPAERGWRRLRRRRRGRVAPAVRRVAIPDAVVLVALIAVVLVARVLALRMLVVGVADAPVARFAVVVIVVVVVVDVTGVRRRRAPRALVAVVCR